MDHFDKLSKEERLRNIALDRHMAEVIHDKDDKACILACVLDLSVND